MNRVKYKLRKICRLTIGMIAWGLYELLLDGSGIGMKKRWHKIKAWSEGATEKDEAMVNHKPLHE